MLKVEFIVYVHSLESVTSHSLSLYTFSLSHSFFLVLSIELLWPPLISIRSAFVIRMELDHMWNHILETLGTEFTFKTLLGTEFVMWNTMYYEHPSQLPNYWLDKTLWVKILMMYDWLIVLDLKIYSANYLKSWYLCESCIHIHSNGCLEGTCRLQQLIIFKCWWRLSSYDHVTEKKISRFVHNWFAYILWYHDNRWHIL